MAMNLTFYLGFLKHKYYVYWLMADSLQQNIEGEPSKPQMYIKLFLKYYKKSRVGPLIFLCRGNIDVSLI